MIDLHVVNRRWLCVVALVLAALLVSGVAVTAQGPQPQGVQAALGPGFTYQGQLKNLSGAINGTCNIQFSLWDAQGGGTQVGSTHTIPGVPVNNGLFTALVNSGGQFGVNPFNGQERWLQAAVQCGSDPGYTTLSRQRLTAAPYATYATGNWGLNGNAGTTASNFLGTMDNMSLTLRVNNSAALRLIPSPDAPIIIGGYSGNSVSGTADGATIAGGGSSLYGANVMNGVVSWSTIGGGFNNRIIGTTYQATIGGGEGNQASGAWSTVSGGNANTANGDRSVVSGGSVNKASDLASTASGGLFNSAGGPYSTVSGGHSNTASGFASTVSGGESNQAGGYYSFAAGSFAHANQQGAFVWADSSNFNFNSGGTNQFDVRATGGISLVTGIDGAGSPTATVSIVNGNINMPNGNISFGSTTRQMLNLWSNAYGIGVQSLTEYFRSDDGFAWFKQGVHSDSQNEPGSGGTRLMKLDSSGDLWITGTLHTGGADLAERIVTSDRPEPGDVVEIDSDQPGQFRLARSANSSAVAGVVSTHPGVRLNVTDDGSNDAGVQLALAGRVPVKVSAENGAIRPGDLLVASSTAGHAMRAPLNPAPGTIIGKALGSLDDGTGLIEMLVMLR